MHMNINKYQKGVGMMEILVALLLLAIGVMGFTALQLKAISATDEAMSKIDAMNLARDLAERIRVNKDGLATYVSELNKSIQSTTSSKNCLGTQTANVCSNSEMAVFDSVQIVTQAQSNAMRIALPECQVSGSINRTCVYVAWGDTQPTNSTTDEFACTNGGAYLPKAQCVVMELY